VNQLRTIVVAGFLAATVLPAAAVEISGAGATFPYPIYAKWADAYHKETGFGLNYQSIGSGGGIKQIQNKTVTFGASDMPLHPADLKKWNMVQFPTVIGGDVPVVNLEGIKSNELKLDGDTLAKIFLGEITKWDDPAIKRLNPNAKLPSQAIVVVHRSDGSGTTFIWTDYLSKVNEKWKSDVGANTSVEWPTGIGAKGNEGVSNNVSQTKGSIGYVEYAYAKQNGMTTVGMINKDGKTVVPDAAAFQAAAAYGIGKTLIASMLSSPISRARRRGRSQGRHLFSSTSSRRTRLPPPRRSSSSLGRMPRATRWPRNSITSRCRKRLSIRSRICGQKKLWTQAESRSTPQWRIRSMQDWRGAAAARGASPLSTDRSAARGILCGGRWIV